MPAFKNSIIIDENLKLKKKIKVTFVLLAYKNNDNKIINIYLKGVYLNFGLVKILTKYIEHLICLINSRTVSIQLRHRR